MINLSGIRNIIFDLGDVLLPIDFDAPVAKFKMLGLKGFENLYSKIGQSDVFDLLEQGKISESKFRDSMREMSGENWTDKQIDDAWNSMLLDYRKGTVDMLRSLGETYNVYLLSNTNSIHFRFYNQKMIDNFEPKGLSSFFKIAFYSHEMDCRKPSEEIFQKVIDTANVLPSETIFIDDNADNIRTANRMGFSTHLMDKKDKIEELITY